MYSGIRVQKSTRKARQIDMGATRPGKRRYPETPPEAFGVAIDLLRRDQTLLLDLSRSIGRESLTKCGVDYDHKVKTEERAHITLVPRGYVSTVLYEATHNQGLTSDKRFKQYSDLYDQTLATLARNYEPTTEPIEITGFSWFGNGHAFVATLDTNSIAFKNMIAVQGFVLASIGNAPYLKTDHDIMPPNHVTIMRTCPDIELSQDDMDSVEATFYEALKAETVALGGLKLYAGDRINYI